MGFEFRTSGVAVPDFGFRDPCSGIWVSGSGIRSWGARGRRNPSFRVSCFGFRVSGSAHVGNSGVRVIGFRFAWFGFGARGQVRVSGSGFRVSSSSLLLSSLELGNTKVYEP